MRFPPALTLLQEKKTGRWLIERYAEDPRSGGLVAFQPPEPIPESVPILDVVSTEFEAFSARPPIVPGAAFRWQPEEASRFDRRHRHVTVTLKEPSVLRIAPLVRGRRGFRGADSTEAVLLQLPVSDQEFLDALSLVVKRSS